MNPSIQLRIDSVIRALEDTVDPAVAGDERAAEQLQMAIAHLRVIREQLDIATSFDRYELRCFEGLGEELMAASSGGPSVVEATRTLRTILASSYPPQDPAAIRDRTDRLGRAIERLIFASYDDGDDAFQVAARTAVLNSERERVNANRSFFVGMAWESDVLLTDLNRLLADPTTAQ
ncbi:MULTISPECIES: hypothetical protein [unclassified Rhodococcus (in: high G+C Gram-positive bacteria)]|uniref:hypothetical protein n=1 Tax=unclassified Rhodococcus (in: high G+C Gram-positive bacteria) TaxID=192944 RepID=UPI00163974B9|nr:MULTISPECIES: hypothetical protein [unclassified Rhodococcus (in: high G+C Gram-positive bacteria)]MBC2637617.1 hypothetical protein [Rhodococcus sp. 3A]MBC2897639.1 hypothetical protein [Rhodococcus sp. 4CII]